MLTTITDSIQQSREHIENEANANAEAAYCDLSQRLTKLGDQFKDLKMQAVRASDAIVQPLREQELDWVSSNGKQSGKTPLGNRMKKFEKVFAAEEVEIARQSLELRDIDAEIHSLALELVGQEGYERVMAGNFGKSTWLGNEQREMHATIEKETQRFLEQIEQASNVSMQIMKDSEKVLLT